MNKYMRAKKFKANNKFNYHQHYYTMDNKKGPSKKEFQIYCIVILILLLCTVFYAICIHFNIFGIKDWYRENPEAKTDSKYAEQAYKEHTVQPNETIWGIAETYRPDEDTRKVVYEIRKANASRSGEKLDPKILPGQVIRVPK